MSGAHTPGPWLVNPANLLEIAPDRGDGQIEPCLVTRLPGTRDDPHRKANARLIAAAPELLEVAERIFERGYVSSSIEEERDDHYALAAAIAKARGAA